MALFVAGWLVTGGMLAALLGLELGAGSALVDHLITCFRGIAAVLFFGAGVLRLSRWRINGESRSALMGVALINFGALTFPLSSIAGLLHESDRAVTMSPLTQALTTSVTITFVVLALRAPTQGPQLRPGRLTLLGVGFVLSTFAGLVVAHQVFDVPLDPAPWTHFALELTLAAAWFGIAVLAARRASRMDWAGRAAPLLAAMGVVAALRGWAVFDIQAGMLVAAAFSAVVAGITLVCAMSDLGETASQQRSLVQEVKQALVSAEDVQHAHDDQREELAHDARNAIAGLRAALATLAMYDEQLDASTSQRLREGVLDEIGHLEHLIVRSDRDELVDFEVSKIVRPVVEMRRAAGLDVSLYLDDCWGHGRPGDLATALQNLLVNAQKHASGTASVRVRKVGDQVQIHVEDRGPGIVPQQRDGLFERGARGSSSTGSGLGLYVSRNLMLRQGGDLRFQAENTRGARFVLSLPATTMTRRWVESAISDRELRTMSQVVT